MKLGILAGNSNSKACIPLSICLHDGLKAAAAWTGSCVSASSHVVQMVENAYLTAQEFGTSLLLLDRYFLSVSALERLAQLNREGSVCMQIVTKAKKTVLHTRNLLHELQSVGVRLKKELPSIWKHSFLPAGNSF